MNSTRPPPHRGSPQQPGGRTDAESADTDLPRANVLNVRSEAMCESVPDCAVQDWIGTVESADAMAKARPSW